MNNYITLNGMKYMCPFKMWEPVTEKPMNVRYTWSGTIDVTYGPGVFKQWVGVIRALVTPLTGWGSVSDARNAIALASSVSFYDHYGDLYTVHVMPDGAEKSMSPMWSGPSNAMLFPIKIISGG